MALLIALALAGFCLSGPTRGADRVDSPGSAERATADVASDQGSRTDPVAPVLIGLVVMLSSAKLAGRAAELLRQPAVLGELLAGILIGAVGLLGWKGLVFIGEDSGLRVLAELGVILLLFEVGLESDLADMKTVGWSSLVVAVLGVVTPFGLGWAVAAWLLPNQPTLVHVFVGATLCATSVGITARVLTDLGRLQDRESKIILGAAVLDDVLGLVILAVVTGAIDAANRGMPLDVGTVAVIVAKALAFLCGAIVVGGRMSRILLRLAAQIELRGMLLIASLTFCLLFAWLAHLMGLATIVGAFAAGLILDEVHYHDARDGEQRSLTDLLQPLALVLVPLFFVRMGAEVDLRAFGKLEVLGLAALLTIAAIVGKMACAVGVLERGRNRLMVAAGMLPRGEVGLIFAAIGARLMLHGERVVSAEVYSAVVVMVLATTLVSPPLLKLTLSRSGTGRRRGETGGH